MTNAELIQKIRNEIERLKAKYRKDMYKSNYEGFASGYKIEAYNELLSFLSTLESEKPMQEGLEEDVKSWFFNEISSKINVEHTMYYYFQECARRYAQWGAEHFASAGKTSSGSSEIPKDLEEAAENHIRKVVDAAGHPGWNWTTQDIADAFIAGAKWQREQMMKEAVEKSVCLVPPTNPGKILEPFVGLSSDELKGYVLGDKVRIIIVKED